MAYLIDTSILVRLANTADKNYPAASQSVFRLHQAGEVVCLTPQVLIEFRNVTTRPISMNGLGLSVSDAESKAAECEALFPLLDDTPAVYSAWKKLVTELGIIGKQVHDARLVAVCHVHSTTHLLTFNVSHFARMAGSGPGITVVAPTVL